jgi:hypothetical protein
MEYKATLQVEKAIADQLEEACVNTLSDCARDEPLFDEEVVFENGNRMAIQVIASTEPDKEPAWTQGVVFDKVGNELGCTDVGESFLGEYFVFSDDDTYVCDVVIKGEQ